MSVLDVSTATVIILHGFTKHRFLNPINRTYDINSVL